MNYPNCLTVDTVSGFFIIQKHSQNVVSEILGDKDYTNGTTQRWQANAKVLVHYKVSKLTYGVVNGIFIVVG